MEKSYTSYQVDELTKLLEKSQLGIESLTTRDEGLWRFLAPKP